MMNSQAAKASPRWALATADEHDLVVRLEIAVAMDHRAVDHLPAGTRFLGNFLLLNSSVIPG